MNHARAHYPSASFTGETMNEDPALNRCGRPTGARITDPDLFARRLREADDAIMKHDERTAPWWYPVIGAGLMVVAFVVVVVGVWWLT